MIIVQIGANRGYDELTSIIKDLLVTKLILVEPLNKFNDSLLKCYSHIKDLYIENIAITDDPNQETSLFFLHEKMDGNLEQASLLECHVNKVFNKSEYTSEKTYENQLIKTQVDCSTINKLFDKYKLNKIDILFIDAEGFDQRIIKSIDFKQFDIKKIYYENMHIDKNELSCFLENLNYNVVNETEYSKNNSIAIKKH